MVDFNNDSMLGTNRSHILDLIVLQRRDDFINEYREYRYSARENRSDSSQKLNKTASSLEVLFIELDCLLRRRVDVKKHKFSFEELKKSVRQVRKEEDILIIFNIINNILDELNITRIDNRKQLDYTDIEAVNTEKGL